jgi:hypothetical protein
MGLASDAKTQWLTGTIFIHKFIVKSTALAKVLANNGNIEGSNKI